MPVVAFSCQTGRQNRGGSAGQLPETVNFSYHNQKLLTSAWSDLEVYVQASEYDAAGRLDERALGLNKVVFNPSYYDWTVPDGGRLQSIRAGTPTLQSSLVNLTYDYDTVGNILTINDGRNTQTQSYTYDAQNRLRSAVVTGGGNGLYDNTGANDYRYSTVTGRITTLAGVDYSYLDSAHDHAVTHLDGIQRYWYDANGNQSKRVTGANTDDLRYDAENRLVEVKRNGSVIASFVYDGDGNRVKGTVDGTTTIYVGNHYEREGSVVRRYYYAGSERVAMRVEGESNAAENGVLWLLGDHLGSTSVKAYEEGGYKAHRRYKAWGEIRDSSGSMGTNFRYTGQRLEEDLGLYLYGARWYDPALGRFTQPDTIVPDPAKPKAFDRYAYSYNNPVKYTDPTGHMPCAVCGGESYDPYDQVDWIETRRLTKEEKEAVTTAVEVVVAVFRYDGVVPGLVLAQPHQTLELSSNSGKAVKRR